MYVYVYVSECINVCDSVCRVECCAFGICISVSVRGGKEVTYTQTNTITQLIHFYSRITHTHALPVPVRWASLCGRDWPAKTAA
jgi:hypothetical protein